jgi:hypothetical protein
MRSVIPSSLIGLFNLVSGTLNGVPLDLIPLLPKGDSPDFGLFSTCEIPRGSRMGMAGICVPYPTLISLAFCGDSITYAACVPPTNPLWPMWNATSKDALVRDLFTKAVADRKAREAESLSGTGEGYVPLLFTGNDACMDQYKRVLCLQNFPACDDAVVKPQTSEIFGLCSQRCVDYFSTCRIEVHLTQEVCVEGSSWPYTANYTTESSSLVDQSLGECTGKFSEVFLLSPLLLFFISIT